ncbi:uncharacterized protein LOC110440285 [Mizuhopecten yessoensis]|uniref:ADAM family mig-17 n=1 Tax=Mizuhopecten yessoensis TaxID=6573 RepID=A0A210PLJ8_MIZYE|nr:uncharacterized protein LOC110440285 [Mizuhopecten yessoensis]OWF37337.1 ADAM family mig-17 [Mizuhopecten yessoensis]
MRIFITTVIIFLHILESQCLIPNTGEPEPSNNPIDVAIIESNDNSSPDRMAMGMPFNLNMGIELQSAKPVSLSLKLVSNKNELRDVYVTRMDERGRKTLRKENIPIHKNVAFYQDIKTGAACKVTCKGLSRGHCDPLLTGSFNVEGVEYAIQMIPGDSSDRVKRSLGSRGHRKGRLYKVFKTKRHLASMSDYMDTGGAVNKIKSKRIGLGTRIGAMRQSESVIDLTSNSSSDPMAMRTTGRIINSNRPTPHKRALYHLGILLVIDNNIYQRFYDATPTQSSPFERDEQAKANIREHMANIINGVDLRFNNFETFEVKVAITGYVIIDKEEDSRWTLQKIAKRPRDILNASIALAELFEWKKDFRQDLPPHDHLMLFTQYDLYVKSFSDTKVAGFAHIRAVCKEKGISVVEDEGGFDNILTATHELAHSLGASHDGDRRYDNHCDPNDGFIMTAVGGGTAGDATKGQNSYRFSTCSEEQIVDYFETIGPGHCLENEDFVYDTNEFDRHVSTMLGQKYNPNEQCALNLGYPSYYAWGGRLGEPHDICTSMACKNRLSSESFNIFNAYRGTSCGDKRWCIDGVCTVSEFAPGRNDVCVHGDSRRKFGRNRNMSCNEFLSAQPFRCYDPYYSMFCCSTCARLRKNTVGCEYGDKNTTECALLESRKDLCYIEANAALCCSTCARHYTNVSGCEYGDRYRLCNPSDCETPENAKFCCETCGDLGTQRDRSFATQAPLTLLSLTTLRPPTRRPFFTSRPPVTLRPRINVPRDINSPKPPQSPSGHATIPEGQIDSRLWCVKENTTFFQASCTWLDTWLRGICKNNLFRSTCCEPCAPLKPPVRTSPLANVPRNEFLLSKNIPLLQQQKKKQTVLKETKPACFDSGRHCADIAALQCYDLSTRKTCCATCESLRTDMADCPFGDRNSRCQPTFKMDPDYACTQKRSLCCYSCRGVTARIGKPAVPASSHKRNVPTSTPRPTKVRNTRHRSSKRVKSRRRSQTGGRGHRIYGSERHAGRDAAAKRFLEQRERQRRMRGRNRFFSNFQNGNRG